MWYRTKWQQRGMMYLMKGIFAVLRNPTAHEPKARWVLDERESAVRVPRGDAR